MLLGRREHLVVVGTSTHEKAIACSAQEMLPFDKFPSDPVELDSGRSRKGVEKYKGAGGERNEREVDRVGRKG